MLFKCVGDLNALGTCTDSGVDTKRITFDITVSILLYRTNNYFQTNLHDNFTTLITRLFTFLTCRFMALHSQKIIEGVGTTFDYIFSVKKIVHSS